ncbi:MAG: ribonuclease E, partial [Desulfuromonas sp.]
MSKKMLINAILPEENRVAIVENGLLNELDIEVAGQEQTKGNIYKAVVVRVEPGLQAAFVDYGAERLGFLQIDEVNFKTVRPDYQSGEGRGRPRITDLLHRGQELLVQITKEERGTKGAALSTYLSLAGRYMVLMPDSSTRGVSRKAENDAQRKQLKKAMATLELPENVGYIVRTAALDQTREELERDSRYLLRLYENIRHLSGKAKAPALIYKESNLVIRSIRDYFTTDMDEV